MPITSPTLVDGKLIITQSDENFSLFGDFFELVVDAETLEISSAQESIPENGIITLRGKADVWAGPDTQILIECEEGSKEVQKIILIAGLDEIENISLPGVGFSNLGLYLVITSNSATPDARLNYRKEIRGNLNPSPSASIPFILGGLGSETYSLESTFESGKGPGIDDLISLLGNGTDLQDWLPEDVLGGRTLALKSLKASLEPGQSEPLQKLSRIATAIELTGDPWQPINGFEFLKIGDVRLALAVDYPLEADYRFPSVNLSGAIILGKTSPASILLNARWPDLAISGSLAEGDSLFIHELLQDLDLPIEGLPAGDKALEVDQLSFQAEPLADQKSFSFFINVKKVWSLTLSGSKEFNIENVSLSLNFKEEEIASTKKVKKVQGTFAGIFSLASVRFGISASNEEGEKGFTFKGGLDPETPIPLGELISDLKGQFPLADSFDLPTSLVNLEIRQLDLAFNTHSKDFFFNMETSMPLREGLDADLQLSLELIHLGNDYQLQLTGILTLAEMQFEMVLQKTSASSSIDILFFDTDGLEVDLFGTFLDAFNDNPGEAELVPSGTSGPVFLIYQLGIGISGSKTGKQVNNKDQIKRSYNFTGQFAWDTGFKFLDDQPTIKVLADIDITKDTILPKLPSAPATQGSGIHGSIKGFASLPIKNFEFLKLGVIYTFVPEAEKSNEIGLFINIGSVELIATPKTVNGKKAFDFTVNSESTLELKEILSFFAGLVDPSIDEFNFSPPWDSLLDSIKIPLKGITIGMVPADKSITFEYDQIGGAIPDELKPFLSIKSILLGYSKKGKRKKLLFQIDGTFLGVSKKLGWDPVNDPPPEIPGKGGKFDIQYLGLGQKVAFRRDANFQSISQVMAALTGSIDTSQEKYLDDPTLKNKPPLEAAQALQFSAESNWLIGTQFSLYSTVGVSIIFNDPVLYGLRLDVIGAHSKLAGLSFEILYQKISDTLGKYHAELSMPPETRRIEMGALVITMPTIVIDIFTNGDFKIDFGYPWNNDFSRSFGIEYFPFIGKGGFFFNKLSAASATSVPKIVGGVFTPVLEFGIGLSIGLGKSFSKGPIEAEFSISVEGLIAGVISFYNPNDPNEARADYFKLIGSVSIVGKIYGKADFIVISISVEIIARATVSFKFEVYQPTELTLKAEVTVEAEATILGIEVTKSFETSVEEKFTIGEKQATPWRLATKNRSLAARKTARPLSSFISMRERLSQTRTRSLTGAQALLDWTNSEAFGSKKLEIDLFFQPAMNLVEELNDQNGTQTKKLKVKGIALLFIENSIGLGNTGTSSYVDDAKATNSSFDELLKLLLKWSFEAYLKTNSPDKIGDKSISLTQLKDLFECFKEDANKEAFSYAQLGTFLDQNIVFSITDSQGPKKATFFPMPPELELELGDNTKIAFDGINYTLNESQIDKLKQNAREQRVKVRRKTTPDSAFVNPATENGGVVITEYLFLDYFRLLGRAAIQAAITEAENSSAKNSILIKDLLKNLNENGSFNHIAGMASHFLTHGSRVPVLADRDKSSQVKSQALFAATQQQFDISKSQLPNSKEFRVRLLEGANTPARYIFKDIDKSGALITTPDHNRMDYEWNSLDHKREMFQLATALDVISTPDSILPAVKGINLELSNPYDKIHRRYPLSQVLSLGSDSLLSFSENLRLFLSDRNKSKKAFLKQHIPGNSPELSIIDLANYTPCTRISFKVSRIPALEVPKSESDQQNQNAAGADEKVPIYTYNIIGLGIEQQNWIEDLLIQNKGLEASLFFAKEGQDFELQEVGTTSQVLLFKTGLQIQSQATPSLNTDSAINKYIAEPSQARDFLRLLWEASKVSAASYHLYFNDNKQKPEEGKGLGDHLFVEGNIAQLELIVKINNTLSGTAQTATDLHSFHNCVEVEGKTPVDLTDVFWEEETKEVPVLQIPAGHLQFSYKRPNHSSFKQAFVAPTATILSDGVLLKEPESSTEKVIDVKKDDVLDFAGITKDTNEIEWVCLIHQDKNGWIEKSKVDLNLGNAEGEFLNNYQLLGYTLVNSGAFKASNDALPIGPVIQESKREEWVYQRVLPVYKFSKRSLESKLTGSPDDTQNPYLAVEESADVDDKGVFKPQELKVKFFWQDFFGNRINSTAANMKDSWPIRYFDPLIGINQWPSLSENYSFSRISGEKAKLVLDLSFEPGNYVPDSARSRAQTQDNIKAAKNSYEEIYYQMADPNVSLAVKTFADLDKNGNISSKSFLSFSSEAFHFLSSLEGYEEVPYQIQEEDSLALISQKLGISLLDLIIANQDLKGIFDNSSLIRIPIAYRIKSSDTLESIAFSNSVDLDTLMQENRFKVGLLAKDQEISATSPLIKTEEGESLDLLLKKLMSQVSESEAKNKIKNQTGLLTSGSFITIHETRSLGSTESLASLITSIQGSEEHEVVSLRDLAIENADLFLTKDKNLIIPGFASLSSSNNELKTESLNNRDLGTFVDDLGISTATKSSFTRELIQANQSFPGIIKVQTPILALADPSLLSKNSRLNQKEWSKLIALSPKTGDNDSIKSLVFKLNSLHSLSNFIEGFSPEISEKEDFITFIREANLKLIELLREGTTDPIDDRGAEKSQSELAKRLEEETGLNKTNWEKLLNKEMQEEENDNLSSILLRLSRKLRKLVFEPESLLTVTNLVDIIILQNLLNESASLLIPPKIIHEEINFVDDEVSNNLNEKVFPVFTELLISRPENLIDTTLVSDQPEIKEVTAFLSPKTETIQLEDQSEREQTASLRNFASGFQEVFPDLYLAFSHERSRKGVETGTGLANNQIGKKYLWAVHIVDPASSKGFGYNILEGSPVYFAPIPVSRNLLSAAFKIPSYDKDSGLGVAANGTKKQFISVDLNSLAREFLVAIEEFLDPSISLEILGRNDNLRQDIANIVDDKHVLAEAISNQLELVLQENGLESDKASAKKALKQQLLKDLVKGFDQETVIQYKVELKNPSTDNKNFPRFFGQPQMVDILQKDEQSNSLISIKNQNNLDFSLSSAKLPLSSHSPFLSFVFNTQSPEKYEDIFLDFVFRIQSLEHEIAALPDLDDYEDSSWLTFLKPEDLDNYQITVDNLPRLKAHIEKTDSFNDLTDDQKQEVFKQLEAMKNLGNSLFKLQESFVEKLSSLLPFLIQKQIEEILSFARLTPGNPNYLGTSPIPIPLRSYPLSPAIIQHRADEDPDSEKTLKEVRNWVYNFTYEHQDVAQDTVLAKVFYNSTPPEDDKGELIPERLPSHKLFIPLIKFSEIYPLIQKDLLNFSALSEAQQKIVLEAFASLVHEVSTAWNAWSINPADSSGSSDLADFIIQEELLFDQDANLTHLQMEIELPVASVLGEFPDLDVSGFEKPEKFLENGNPVSSLPAGQKAKKLIYKLAALSAEDAASETNLGEKRFADRTMNIQNRDVLQQQNAWASVKLLRNSNLIDGKITNPAFVFRTPEVRFRTKVTPFIINNERWDMEEETAETKVDPTTKRNLRKHLEEVFKIILPDKAPHKYDIRIGCEYGFAIAEGDPFTVDLLTRLPVVLGMRFTFNQNEARFSSRMNTLLDNLVKAVTDWQNDNCPERSQGMFIFHLTLFSHLDSKNVNLPLLKIEHLGLRLKDIEL